MVLYYIYCIWVKTENGVLRYYGHTQNMRVRKGDHVKQHKVWVKAGKPEKVSDVNATRSVLVLDHEDWRMDKVDEIECEDKKDAEKLEGEWILKYECVNMHVAGRTQKQYRETHKKEKKEYNKQYRETHYEEIVEQQKQYYEKNKDKCNERQKQYWETNKEEIKKKRAGQVTCEVCGKVVSKRNISIHHKTKKCQNALN
jgi:hypothetical protein